MVGTSIMACSLKYYLSLVMAITHEHNIILEQQIKLLLEVINKNSKRYCLQLGTDCIKAVP